jgi:AraC-like DNA-binding protein
MKTCQRALAEKMVVLGRSRIGNILSMLPRQVHLASTLQTICAILMRGGLVARVQRRMDAGDSETNLAALPGVQIAVSVSRPTGGAARTPGVLLNDTAQRLDGHPLADFDPRHTYDTYDGQNQAGGPDWYALTFPVPVSVNCVEMTTGFAYYNGGWWLSLAVHVQTPDSPQWRTVDGLVITPPYSFMNARGERRPYETYELVFDAVTVCALRVVGRPGGSAQFTSLARLAVYQRDRSRRNLAGYLAAAPIPELFRLVSPQVVWDLSASARKLTGLLISLPLMEYYLDGDRYQQCWQARRSTYEGEPKLWFLLGETLGWDTWNTIDTADVDSVQEPYVQATFDGTLAHAIAPVVVGSRVLGTMTSDAAILLDQLDWSHHQRLARRHGIPWASYKAAVQRTPQLTHDQMEGLATLVALIANPIANLAYHFDAVHDGSAHRTEQRRQVVRRAITYMQAHLEDPIGVVDIARSVALSPHYLGELFLEQTGLSPGDFLVRLRIERAKEYLTYTNMSPSAVCLALGYSASYFWRLFKRQTGYTPGHYADKMRTQARQGESRFPKGNVTQD